MEVENQLGDANIYEEVLNNICRKGEFVLVLLTISYLRMPSLPELIVPGREVTSNCGSYSENISSFLDFQLQPIAKKFKSNIKDTNDFLKKFCSVTNLPENSFTYCGCSWFVSHYSA